MFGYDNDYRRDRPTSQQAAAQYDEADRMHDAFAKGNPRLEMDTDYKECYADRRHAREWEERMAEIREQMDKSMPCPPPACRTRKKK